MATQGNNRKMKVRACTIAMASCFVVSVVIVLSISATAGAKKPGSGGPGGDTQDIPICVTVNDTVAIASDGDPLYCHSKKEHVGAIIGRSVGSFHLDTNTNNASGGRTMNLTFGQPVDGGPADEGPDPLFSIPGSVAPVAVKMKTARSRVADFGGRGYEDLRTMGDTNNDGVLDAGEEALLPVCDLIAARITLIVTNEQHEYLLQYRSTAWSENDPEAWPPKLNETDFLIVTRTSAATWTVESGPSAKAHLSRRLGWNATHDVGVFDMPISLEIELQQ